MRNTKKLIAVIMTIAILASMMVPALAASYQTEAEKLMAVGLMKGTGDGAGLEMALDRIQGITFTIRAMGVEEEALAMTEAEIAAALENVTDADTIPAWGRAYAAYAVKEGITNGVSASEFVFAPFAKLSGKQFITMMLRALNYTGVTLDNCLEKAIAAGMLTAGKAVEFGKEDQLLRDGAAYIIYSTAKNGLVADEDGVTPSDMTLIGQLVADGVITATDAAANFDYEAPAAADTTAITFTAVALNAIQFKLTFDQALNADDAVDEKFYTIKDKEVGDAALQADGSVILTITNYAPFGNNSKAEITLEKDIRNAAGIKLAADYTVKDIPVFDTTFPTFDSVEAIGSKNLRLHFSEPVWAGLGTMTTATSGLITANLNNYFEVSNSTYKWVVQDAKINILNKYIDLRLGTNLIEGALDVKVKKSVVGSVDYFVRDFAGNRVEEKTIAFTFAKDPTAPVASIKSASQKEVKITFNKPVYGKLVIAHSYKGTDASSGYRAVVTPYNNNDTTAADEYKANFTLNPLPAGNVTLYVFALEDTDVKDLYGNKLIETVLTATVTLDTTAPAYSSYKLNTNESIDITFDEALDPDTAKSSSNYTLKKADGTAVSIKTPVLVANKDDKVVRIAPISKFTDNTDYVLTIKKTKDVSGNTTTSESVVSFKTGDNTSPWITGDTFAVKAGSKIYVYFSEPMDTSTMTNKANYLVNTTGSAFVVLGDDDTVTAQTDKIALIDLAGDDLATFVPSIKVSSAVTDVAGKKLNYENAASATLQVEKLAIGTEQFYLDKAEAIATDKVKLTFKKDVASFDLEDFGITNGISGQESISGKEVVLTLTTKLGTDAKNGAADAYVTVTGTDTKSVYGSVVDDTTAPGVKIADKIAPEVAKGTVVNVDKDKYLVNISVTSSAAVVADADDVLDKDDIITVSIKFTEAMDWASFSNLTFTVAGYTVDKYSAIAIGDTYTFEAKANADYSSVQPAVTQVYNVRDLEGNTLSSGTVFESILRVAP